MTEIDYWQFVRLNTKGRSQTEVIPSIRSFFQQQFTDLRSIDTSHNSDVPHPHIQRHLMQLRVQNDTLSTEDDNANYAEYSLRCFISNQITQVCRHLASQFGTQYQFTQEDLLPLVLDDEGHPFATGTKHLTRDRLRSIANSYRCLALQILDSFDPEQSRLSTWVKRLVRQHPEMNRFLRQQGLSLISDWALLNDTQPHQLVRILTDFHGLAIAEIESTVVLLQSYHQIYRQARIQQRLAQPSSRRSACQIPTPEQLQQMACLLQPALGVKLSPTAVIIRLQQLARQLREYRTAVRHGTRTMLSFDRPELQALAIAQPTDEFEGQETEQQEFLAFYQEQFLKGLEQTLAQVIRDRITFYQGKKPPSDQQFLKALYLFHQGQSMGEIATQVGLQAQYQVTRLLKLKELRADVQQRLLCHLRDRVLEKAKDYTDAYADPDALQKLHAQVEAALSEQINQVMQQAAAEASTARNQPLKTLFAQKLYQQLQLVLEMSQEN